MPTPPPLLFDRGTYWGKPIYFRRSHVIVKVISQSDDSQAVTSIISDILADLLSGQTVNIVGELLERWAYLRLDPGTDVLALVKNLNEDPRVDYAEPDLRLTGSSASDYAGDPYLKEGADKQQWGIDFLKIPEVWGAPQVGDASVLIGLIDSGVPLDENGYGTISLHDPLTEVIDHVDLDGARFIAGKNRLYDDPIPWPQDGLGHGTNMAGILAATANNKDEHGDYIGTAGINWGSSVYVSVALDSGNRTTIALVRQATAEIIEYAAISGNPNLVLNLSINYEETDKDPFTAGEIKTIKDMFNDIQTAGAVVCISGGNGTPGTDGTLIYEPALTGITEYAANVITTGAITQAWDIQQQSARGVADMVFAPGEGVCTTDKNPFNIWDLESLTSIANAHVTGVASLIWSEDPGLKASEVVKCIKKNGQFPTGYFDEENPWPEDLSHGVVNASSALQSVRGSAELLTPSIIFDDAEPGLDHEQEIQIEIDSCREARITVSTTGFDFGVSSGTYTYDPCTGEPFRLVVTYRDTDGDTETGTVTVVWETEPEQRWDIGISAHRAVRRKSIFLVLDESGSMGTDSGIGSYTRLEVLKYSAGILIDMIEPGDGLGAVSFDKNAHDLADYTVIPPENPDPARAALKAAVDTLESGGQTSIAAGLARARAKLDDLPATDSKAIIVLTDGRETHEPWLADAMAEGNPYPIYAIGMGTPSTLQPEGLVLFEETTAGYWVLTGALDEATEFRLAECMLQILADLAGDSIAYDPTQTIRAGMVHRYPVKLSDVDKKVDVIILRPPGAPLQCRVTDPAGRKLGQDKIKVTGNDRLIRLGFRGPGAHAKGGSVPNGVWHVEVGLPASKFSDWVKHLKGKMWDTPRLRLHGPAYAMRVHTRSKLRLRCRVVQTDHRPGSIVTVLAQLTERGRPLAAAPRVTVQVTDPHGVVTDHAAAYRRGGSGEVLFKAMHVGTYRVKITAEGATRQGHAFRREYRLTAGIWRDALPGGVAFGAGPARPVHSRNPRLRP